VTLLKDQLQTLQVDGDVLVAQVTTAKDAVIDDTPKEVGDVSGRTGRRV
jgi:hypothetical protein